MAGSFEDFGGYHALAIKRREAQEAVPNLLRERKFVGATPLFPFLKPAKQELLDEMTGPAEPSI
jgi:hypothetical protein